MHSHSDLILLSEPRHEAKVRQGVTTEALGMDGLSYAPASPANQEALFHYLAAVNGEPPPEVRWGSVKEFLDLFDGRASCNVVYFVPHAAIRVEAMGWDDRQPTGAEIRRMQELAREGMRDGAFGFATGLTYPPRRIQRHRRVGGRGRGNSRIRRVLHDPRPLYPGGWPAGSLPGSIDRRAQDGSAGPHLPLPQSGGRDGRKNDRLVDEGRSEGIDVTFDQYPYPAASTLLHSLLPYWVHSGGPAALLRRIQDRNVRGEIGESVTPQWGMTLEHYIFSHVKSEANKEWEGRSLTDLHEARGGTMVDAICDLLIEENLEVAFVARTGNPDNIRTILRHPAQMVGSDGLLTGGHPNPRSYGTFPYVLGQFCREEGLLRLEDGVRKMTALPAQRLGLRDRGILRDGMKADIAVFDPQRINATATFENPRQYPVGIDYVIVNGQVVVDNGVHTGAFPGRALRSQ